jgi:hypothetical protein
MCIPIVTQGIEDGGERTDGGNDSEQDGCGAERLVASDIEGRSGECGDADGRRLPGEWVWVGFLRREPSRGRSGGVGHTDSLDALPKCGVSRCCRAVSFVELPQIEEPG